MEENTLSKILTNILNTNDLYMDLYFTKKGTKKYISYRPNVSCKIKYDILEMIKKFLLKKQDTELVRYSPTRYPNEGQSAFCDIDYVGNFDEVISSFNSPDEVDTKLKPADISFYCFMISDKNKTFEYKLFRRTTKFKKLSTGNILAAFFSGNELCKLSQDFFGVDGYIDLICDNKTIYIFNNISLERIFKLKEQFTSKATEALDIIEKAHGIANFEEFKDDCLSDSRIHKTLCKILGNIPNLDKAFENFNNIKIAIDKFDLDIEVDDENKQLIYERKKQRKYILHIINDAYCQSIIKGRDILNED